MFYKSLNISMCIILFLISGRNMHFSPYTYINIIYPFSLGILFCICTGGRFFVALSGCYD